MEQSNTLAQITIVKYDKVVSIPVWHSLNNNLTLEVSQKQYFKAELLVLLKLEIDKFSVQTYHYEVNVDVMDNVMDTEQWNHLHLNWFPINLTITRQFCLPLGT